MDLYAVLGIASGASAAEIRRAYQKHARRLHPDLNPGDPVAAERFRELSQAFQVLSDPQQRARYDRGEPPAPATEVPEVGFAGFDLSAELRLDGSGLRDILQGVLRPRKPGAGERRGEDLEQSTVVSFQESFRGAHRRLHLLRLERCQACDGRGEVELRPQRCPVCQGSGELKAARGRMIFTRRCAECQGSGTVGRKACSRCQGEGRVMQSEWMEVKIPAGVDNGSRVRLPGGGNAGGRGGHAGDFILHLEVEPHPFYRREGADLHCEIPITMVEAALGAHVEVPTLEGPMSIEVPAGTQNGQRFRLRKRGMPRMGEASRGDLFVSVRIWVPTVSDEASRRLLQDFARRHPQDPRRDLPVLKPAAGKR